MLIFQTVKRFYADFFIVLSPNVVQAPVATLVACEGFSSPQERQPPARPAL